MPVRVAIIGAGVSGVVLANYLTRAQAEVHWQSARPAVEGLLSVTIFERRPTPAGPDGGALLIQGEGLTILDELGVGAELRAASSGKLPQDQLFVMRDALLELLLGCLAAQPNPSEVKTNTEVACLQETSDGVLLEHRPLLTCQGGRWVRNHNPHLESELFDIVIGADGNAPSSQVAKSIMGDELARAESVSLLVLQALVPCETPCEPHQEYLQGAGRVSGKFEISPVVGLAPGSLGTGSAAMLQQWEACTVTVPSQDPMRNFPRPERWAENIMSHTKSIAEGTVRLAANSIVESAQRGTIGRLHAWVPFHKNDLGRWRSSSGRLVVLGDAAHLMPPTLGWGASCAMGDAKRLAICLTEGLSQPLLQGSGSSLAANLLADLDDFAESRRGVVAPIMLASVNESMKLSGAAPAVAT